MNKIVNECKRQETIEQIKSAEIKALEIYLKKNKDKVCEKVQPVFSAGEYVKYKDTQVKKLSAIEIEKYMSERK